MPETTLASPSLRRLTRTGKPDWERYLDTLEYNMPAWNASNWIVKHNIKIIGHVKHIHDYETGKRADPPPFTLPELVNPKLNSRDSGRRNAGLDRLRYLFASMKRYEPGHAPAHNYEPAFDTTRVLILLLKKCADNLGRLPHEQQLETFQTYILDGHPVSKRVRAATRAHQCWTQHREEWDSHVHALGEEKGFADYKSLGRAYRKN